MPEEFDWSLGDEPTSVPEGGNEQLAQGDQQQTNDSGDDSGQRQRDERGRFASARQEDGQGGQVSDQTENAEGEGDAGDALILGKFKSQDDLAQAYLEVEKRFGEQRNEVGQLREDMAEMRGYLDSVRQQEPQYAPVDNETVTALDELAQSDPRQAAAWALQYQPLLYERVMDNWYEGDAKSAARFERQLEIAQLRKEMDERVQPVQHSVQQSTQQDQFNQAWANTAQKYPDMAQHADKMLEAAEAAPELVTALMSGDTSSKEKLIENLFWLTRGRQADALTEAATQMGRQAAQQTADEKRQASVVSGSSVQAHGEKTPVEQWKETFLQAPSTSIAQGLKTLS